MRKKQNNVFKVYYFFCRNAYYSYHANVFILITLMILGVLNSIICIIV